MLFLPVTRMWSAPRVIASLRASDVPSRVMLYIDAPGCEGWVGLLEAAGFSVECVRAVHPTAPPTDPVARRARHLAMRRLSQVLTADRGRVLYIEDDTLVPPDVWSRLSRLLDSGYVAATGIQTSRHGDLRAPGVWVRRGDVWATVWPQAAQAVDACGHFCLMTDGATYATAITPENGEAIDRAHTRRIGPLACDPDVLCGHLLESGEALSAPSHLIAFRHGREVALVKAIRTDAGTFWPEMHGPGHDPNLPYDDYGIQRTSLPRKENPVRDPRRYVTKGTIVRGRGHVEHKRRREIPLTEAQRLHREGCTYLDGPFAGSMAADPELFPGRPFDPREETKPADPRTALKYVCPNCGRDCKSAAGKASHLRAGTCDDA